MEEQKCPICDGSILINKIPYSYHNQMYFGDFEAEVCHQCGNIFFTEDSFKKIEQIAKDRGLWGLWSRNMLNPVDKLTLSIPCNKINIVNAGQIFYQAFTEMKKILYTVSVR